jgi:hypothetical protein
VSTMIVKSMMVTALCLLVGIALADEAMLKPFILASKGAGTIAEKSAKVKEALVAAGFSVVGDYSPYPDAEILVVTSDDLKRNAAASEFGGFGVAERVSITKAKDGVQVSYVNPVYMANAYRMKDDLRGVAERLAAALGKVQQFGSKQGMTAKDLRRYHYMIGMEYFTDLDVLAEYPGHDEAVRSVDQRLTAGRNGVTKVYRVDIPGRDETLFGVAMKASSDAGKYMDDKFIMSEIDFKDVKSTAHLPYEVLVSGNKVYAMHARFRIAINFPDLSMMGKNSFINIMKTPDAVRAALQTAVHE